MPLIQQFVLLIQPAADMFFRHVLMYALLDTVPHHVHSVWSKEDRTFDANKFANFFQVLRFT